MSTYDSRTRILVATAAIATLIGAVTVPACLNSDDKVSEWSAAVMTAVDAGGDDADAGTCDDAADCDDGHVCTDDACVDGSCQHSLRDCDDGDSCTNDCCDEAAGGCVNELAAQCTCQNDVCRAVNDLPSCASIEASNAAIEAMVGKEVVQGESTFTSANGFYEKKFEGQLATLENGFLIAGTGFTLQQLVKGHLACGPSIKTCLGLNHPYRYRWVAGSVTTVATAAAAVAAAASVYHAINVFNELNDNTCRLKVKYQIPQFEFGSEVVGTTDCLTDENEPCAASCDATSCSTQKKLSSIDVKSQTMEPTVPFFHYEEVSGACNADWIDSSECTATSSYGWCMRCSCGSFSADPTWYEFPDVWNVMQAYETCRIDGCFKWGWNYTP